MWWAKLILQFLCAASLSGKRQRWCGMTTQPTIQSVLYRIGLQTETATSHIFSIHLSQAQCALAKLLEFVHQSPFIAAFSLRPGVISARLKHNCSLHKNYNWVSLPPTMCHTIIYIRCNNVPFLIHNKWKNSLWFVIYWLLLFGRFLRHFRGMRMDLKCGSGLATGDYQSCSMWINL